MRKQMQEDEQKARLLEESIARWAGLGGGAGPRGGAAGWAVLGEGARQAGGGSFPQRLGSLLV